MDTSNVVSVRVAAENNELNCRSTDQVDQSCSRRLDFYESVGDRGSNSSTQQRLEEAFYSRLLELKEQQRNTLKSMEALYQASVLRYEDSSSCVDQQAYEQSRAADLITSTDDSHHSMEHLDGGILAEDSCSSTCYSDRSSSQTALDSETDSLDKMWQTDSIDLLSEMWTDFNVDDYSSLDLTQQPQSQSDYWSPNFTIPKPFSMTLREEARARKGFVCSSPCIEEAERLQRQREASECAELQFQFCAREVPKSTSELRYKRMCEESIQKREKVREEAKKRFEEMQRPFQFMQREQAKHKQKIEKAIALTAEHRQKAAKFQAKPVPRNLFSMELTEQCLEEELYRQLRIRMRADKLFASSHLPPSMANRTASQRYTVGKLRLQTAYERAQIAGLSKEHYFHPHTNHTVPDFGELHRKLAQDLNWKKNKRPSTVVQPFFLRTSLLGKSKKCSYNTLHSSSEADGHSSHKPTVRVHAPPPTTYVPDCDASHTRSTKSSRLYHNSVRLKAEQQQRAEKQRQMEAAKKEERHKELSQQVSSSVLLHDHTPLLEQEAHQKIHEFRATSLARDKEYEEQLRTMNKRVASMPLLFERAAQTNARRAVERRYQNALQRAGLSKDKVDAIVAASLSPTRQWKSSNESASCSELSDGDQ